MADFRDWSREIKPHSKYQAYDNDYNVHMRDNVMKCVETESV